LAIPTKRKSAASVTENFRPAIRSPSGKRFLS
jgi:hypothetical protein